MCFIQRTIYSAIQCVLLMLQMLLYVCECLDNKVQEGHNKKKDIFLAILLVA